MHKSKPSKHNPVPNKISKSYHKTNNVRPKTVGKGAKHVSKSKR
jgi:hypothetical protein